MATILLGGSSGFIGSALARSLAADGHQVVPLVRVRASAGSTGQAAGGPAVAWEPESGRIDREQLARAAPDVVVNLAGEPIAQRWTPQRRRKIRDSRVRATAALAESITSLGTPPRVFVSGSAIGYYGAHRGDEQLDERSLPGTDFLAQAAGDWEAAALPASQGGIRVVISRTGLVVGNEGGVLERMLLPFKLGLGGRMGSGHQWMSWISLEDAVRALRFLIDEPTMAGAVNVVAPEPERNADFARALGRVLHRPAVLPVPRFVLELAFGEMADNTILASQRVIPERLAGAGFRFRHPRLEDALRAALRRSDDRAGH